MKRVPKIAYLALAVLIAVGGVAAVLALDILDPTDTWNVTPVSLAFPEGRACPTGSTLISDQFQSVTQGVLDGTASATYTIDGKDVTVNLIIYPDNSIDFEVIGGVMPQMFVKGGGASYLLYQYEPPVSGATNTGPVTYDTGLHDGVNPNNENEYQDISHLDFCIIPKGEPLTATKTAYGSFDRTVTWTLDKSVDDDSHSGFAGQTAGSSNWSVVATKSEFLGNYSVTGIITITNVNAYAVPFSVADTLNDGTIASVYCPIEVAANSVAVCSYTAAPDDDSATLNTAVITSLDPKVDGTTATAPVSFEENLIGYDSGTLSDPRFDYSESISGTTTITFPETFTCSADPEDYGTTGTYSYTITNWAYLNDNINLSDSEDVTVDCTLKPLVPTKDAAGTYDRTVKWTLEKSVDPASHSGFIGGTAGSSTWTVVADKTETFGNYKVIGEISIYNPAAIPQSFTVDDVLDDGTVASVTCPAYTVAAGGTVTCTYEALPADASTKLNTATVTAVGNPAQTALASVSFTENLIGYDEGTLSDPRFDYSELISGDKTETFDETFVCPTDANLYAGDGHYQFIETNWAYLNDNIDLEDSAQVTVDCYAPVVSKTAYGSYDKTYKWDIEKSVDPLDQSGYPGDELGWTWTVDVSESFTESGFFVEGQITVVNPNPDDDLFVYVYDALAYVPPLPVTITGCTNGIYNPDDTPGPSLTVYAGKTAVCDYEVVTPDRDVYLNKVTVKLVLPEGNVIFQATADITWTVDDIFNGTATVTDDEIGLDETLTAGGGPWTFDGSDSHTCSELKSAYGEDGTYSATIDNTATLTYGDTTKTADASTTYICKAGFMDLTKLTNGSNFYDPIDPMVWTFRLYTGGFGGIELASDSTPPALLDFGGPALRPDTKYTVCEDPVPSGWTSQWMIDGVTVVPYNPLFNSDPVLSQDLGNRCVDFGYGTDYPVVVGLTLHFQVDNSFPGGDPRTPGYWKNWNTCTGGNQQYTATENSEDKDGDGDIDGYDRVMSGWALLDDILNEPGIAWGSFVIDDIYDGDDLIIERCQLGVAILDTRDYVTGKQTASDPGYNLAKHLLAAQLNLAAGACRPYPETGVDIDATIEAAIQLLVSNDYDATGVGIDKKKDKADAASALSLAYILDMYNNGNYCGSTYVP